MQDVQSLIIKAAELKKNKEEAVAAMVELSRIYGGGMGGVRPDLKAAFKWARQAVNQNSPEGYWELSKVVGSLCIAETDTKRKLKLLDFLLNTCDEGTLLNQKNAQAAYNVGFSCEYLADILDGQDIPRHSDVQRLRHTAKRYYKLSYESAKSMPVDKLDKNILKAFMDAELGTKRLIIKMSPDNHHVYTRDFLRLES